MISRRLTLLTDGPFDRVLMAHISWLIRSVLPEHTVVQPQWADFRALPVRPKGLVEKIRCALQLFPCDLLVVHRDAETSNPEPRFTEIQQALSDINCNVKAVPVVPVRMTEAWLLFDQQAIRVAVGNPNGKSPLQVPMAKWDEIPDPKSVLYDALRVASGHSGRRRKKFQVATAAHMVAEYIGDFSPLRRLPAFARFEADMKDAFRAIQWM